MKDSVSMKTVGILTAVALLLGVACAGFAASKVGDLELKIGVADFYKGELDPTQQIGSGARELLQMFDTALQLDEKGAVMPGIVKSWKIAPDHLSWILTVRDDVIFHDGSKLTAHDVAFSYARPIVENLEYAKRWGALLGKKPRIEVTDDYTLRVYTNGPQSSFAVMSTFVDLGCWILPKAYIEKNGAEYFRSHPVGSGPYKFVRFVPGDRMDFEAVNYKHWRVNPEFKRVTHYLIPEEATRIMMLQKGMLDAIPVSLEGAIQLKKKGFTTMGGAEGLAWAVVTGAYHPKAKGSPLADVRVRQALSLAINRQELINSMLYGMAGMPPPARVGWSNPDMTPVLVKKWKDWAAKNYRYDPQEARRLIKEAGYANGFTFDIWSAPDPSAVYMGDIALALAGYWAEVGAKAVIVPVDGGTLNAHAFTTKSTQRIGKMAMDAHGLPRPSTSLYHHVFTTDAGAYDLFAGAPFQGDFDALFKEAISCMDPKRAEELLDKIISMNTSSWTGIPILTCPRLYAFGPRVKARLDPTTPTLAHVYAEFKYTGIEQK